MPALGKACRVLNHPLVVKSHNLNILLTKCYSKINGKLSILQFYMQVHLENNQYFVKLSLVNINLNITGNACSSL